MVKTIYVDGYEAVMRAIQENSNSNALFVLFSGSKDSEGKSWCPDCVAGNSNLSMSNSRKLHSSYIIFHL